MKIADRTKLVAWFKGLMDSLSAQPSTHFSEGVQLDTSLGLMHLWLYEGVDGRDSQDLFCRFAEPSRARPVLGNEVNPHTGKYNCHPGDRLPLDVIQASFLHHIAKVIPNVRGLAAA